MDLFRTKAETYAEEKDVLLRWLTDKLRRRIVKDDDYPH